jgi:transcriptional regulator with XRE-family HTH domain
MTADAGLGPLAQRIDKLFKSVRPKGREYTYDEVAHGCEAMAGTFSKTYVWQLRTGQRDNPTKRHLEALAAFFGVPAAYFFDDDAAERVDSQLELAVALRDADIRDIALRAMTMDEATRRSVAQIVREIGLIRDSTNRGRSDRPSSSDDGT